MCSITYLAEEEDLLYLALLTQEGIKSLSRIEHNLSTQQLEEIGKLGLVVDRITRIAQNGTSIVHVVFSNHPKLVQQYKKEFDGAVLTKSSEVIRKEGVYFGYPRCCIEAFVEHRYEPNDLATEEQAILFHWACLRCKKTSQLLPRYREIWERVQKLRQDMS